jgi:hypothetical protein
VLHSGVTRVSLSGSLPAANRADITDGLENCSSGLWSGIAARVPGQVWSPNLLAGRLEPDKASNRAVRDGLRGSPAAKTLGTIAQNNHGPIFYLPNPNL